MSKAFTISVCGSQATPELADELDHAADFLKNSGIIPLAPPNLPGNTPYEGLSEREIFSKKGLFMADHYEKIKKSDALLVINGPKNGIEGYIGGATLLEMGIAFHYKIPIFILHPYPRSLPYFFEIAGMQPSCLDGNITRILSYFPAIAPEKLPV
mgnify:CR=1 FL=1